MKSSRFSIPELFYCLSFLLYLGGSSYAQAQNGIELSLWLMVFAMVISAATSILPWLGFRWLKLPLKVLGLGEAWRFFFKSAHGYPMLPRCSSVLPGTCPISMFLLQ